MFGCKVNKILTGPGCNRKPASCTLVKGNNSLPPMGGFSITDLNELKKKEKEYKTCNKRTCHILTLL